MPSPPPIRLEVRFGCPHCTQTIACDPVYVGVTVDCPACRRSFVVPATLPPVPQAVPPPLRLAPHAPTAPGPRPAPPPLDVWTQEEWNRRLANTRRGLAGRQGSVDPTAWPLLIAFPFLIVGPPALFLLALFERARWLKTHPEIMIVLAVVSALGGGWVIARQATPNLFFRTFLTLAFALAFAALWLPVALFGGCMVAAGAMGQ